MKRYAAENSFFFKFSSKVIVNRFLSKICIFSLFFFQKQIDIHRYIWKCVFIVNIFFIVIKFIKQQKKIRKI